MSLTEIVSVSTDIDHHLCFHIISCIVSLAQPVPDPLSSDVFHLRPHPKKKKKQPQTNKRKQTKIIQPCHTSFPSKSHHVTAVLAQMEGVAYNETNSCFRFATTVQGKCVFVATLMSLRAGVPDQWPVTSLVLTGS